MQLIPIPDRGKSEKSKSHLNWKKKWDWKKDINQKNF